MKQAVRRWAARPGGRAVKSRVRAWLAPFRVALPMTRTEKLLQNCDLQGIGLEIGPSYHPVAPRSLGYRVEILDHASADGLRAKYQGAGVDVSRIESVDYVWSGEPLDTLTGRKDFYDWIIASHVVEHTTDLVSFLRQCETMLKPDGVLSLAVPDHRYCFDVFRPVSTPGDVIQAYLEKRTRHTPGTVWDHFSLAARKAGAITWRRHAVGKYTLLNGTLEKAMKMFGKTRDGDEYIDAHNWIFTPASFMLVMHDIRALGFTALAVTEQFPAKGCEFIVQLGKTVSGASGHDDQLRMRHVLEAYAESLDATPLDDDDRS